MKFLACISLILTIGAGQAMAADDTSPLLENGMSLHGPLTWGHTNAAHTQYQPPLFDGKDYALPTLLLAKTKAAGFDFIRLSVDPGPFIALKGKDADDLMQKLIGTVKSIRQQELDVLVDLHPIGMMEAYNAKALESHLFDDYVATLGRIVAELAKLDTKHIAIEPMNEPQSGWGFGGNARMQSMMERMYQAVRSQSKDMVVVITGGRGGSINGLLNLDATPFASDPNTRYSFHYYLPYILTHQGVIDKNAPPSKRAWLVTVGIPYPANANDKAAFWQTVQSRVNALPLTEAEKATLLGHTGKEVDEYFAHAGTREAIGEQFDKVAEWAAKYNIPARHMLLGEFGATQQGPSWPGNPAQTRAAWLSDVVKAAEARHFGWAMWSLLGAGPSHGMTLVKVDNPNALDPLTLQALGKSLYK